MIFLCLLQLPTLPPLEQGRIARQCWRGKSNFTYVETIVEVIAVLYFKLSTSGVLKLVPTTLREADRDTSILNAVSVTSCWQLEISCGGSVYTTAKIRNHGFPHSIPRETIIKHLSVYHCHLLISFTVQIQFYMKKFLKDIVQQTYTGQLHTF